MDIKAMKKALVVGLGFRSGLAACNFLAGRGVETVVSDNKSREELADVIRELNVAVRVVAGPQEPSILDEGFDCVVLSPGVPASIPLIRSAVDRNIPVISEIELACRFLKGNIIAITGTDGKSTTTMLTYHILRELGYKVHVGGNIGIPLISIVSDTSDDSITVIELSSFQLETIDSFRPDAAALLNITPDHLDRYDSMEDYFEAKMRITLNQRPDDFFVYNMDDRWIMKGLPRVKEKSLAFSLDTRNGDIFYKDDIIFLKEGPNRQAFMKTKRMFLVGLHNVQNAMASILLIQSIVKKRGQKLDCDRAVMACSSFRGLEHRMEVLGVYQSRTIINDSKATTVGAVEMALRSLIVPGVLILGGRTKGDDYSRLRHTLDSSVRAIVLIGESKKEFREIFHDYHCIEADDLDDALARAMKISHEGDAILLSPACASYDMFANFEERGRVFKEAITDW
jgi:UDP-N-acetylmuramoylalanine--D-glutamate ligase